MLAEPAWPTTWSDDPAALVCSLKPWTEFVLGRFVIVKLGVDQPCAPLAATAKMLNELSAYDAN